MLALTRSGLTLPNRTNVRLPKSGSPSLQRQRCLHATGEAEPTTAEKAQEKFYGTVPGFPGVVIEYDAAPEEAKVKGRFDVGAIVALSGGMVLMLSVVASLLTVGQYL